MNVTCITPILNVSDLAASIEWFEKLGWSKMWDWAPPEGGPTSFGCVGASGGDWRIFLCEGCQGAHGTWMTVWVKDVDAEVERCRAAGVDIAREPANEVWGVREAHVRHPDGHILRLSRSIERTNR